MKNIKKLYAHFSSSFQPWLVGMMTAFISTSIFANPVLDHVSAGQVNIQQVPNSTVINQGSQKAIINWQSFNIGAQESTHFNQPVGGITLNRINPTQGASQIYGRLTATGQIILVNPAGIFFGPSAYVNVGGLIASTANISDQDFLNSYYHFANVPGFNGAIVNQGQIIAADHGLVALVGGAVRNDGMITANLGRIALASGDAFTMSFAGNELIGFSVDSSVSKRAVDKDGKAIADGVTNNGSLYANGGTILISARDAAGILDSAINMNGYAQAMSVYDGAKAADGEIIISGDTEKSIIRLAGTLDVSGFMGGSVDVTGHHILVDNTSVINADGDFGGGTVHIGGNYLGQGPLPTANAVVMKDGAKISANAFLQGDGGQIILWSDNYTNANGSLSATGGLAGGNGGLIETSSKNILNVGNLAVNTSAANGTTGLWLLDPYDITITSGATSGGSFNGGNPNIFTPSATATVQDTTINTNLFSSNVTITTGGTGSPGSGGDITVDNTAVINWNNTNLLTLTAYRNIVNNGSIVSTGGGRLNLIANNSGDFALGANGTVTNNGTLNINGALNIYYNPTAYTAPITYTNIGAGAVAAYMYVNDATDLQNMNSNLAGFYALSKNITAGTFTPVGSLATPFTGGFDGMNHTIDGLTISSGFAETGLFGAINSSNTFANVNLTNVNITGSGAGSSTAGAFAGRADGSVTLTNLSSTGVISGYITGGVIGALNRTSGSGSLSNSWSTATISGINDTGGLVGAAANSTISNSYFGGTINNGSTTASSGGIIGFAAFASSVTNSYNTGTINGGNFVNTGGIAGFATSVGSINQTYNSGLITGSGNIGALVGQLNNGKSATNNFWDADTSGQTNPFGIISGGATENFNYGGCFSGTCTATISSSYLFGGTTYANLSSLATYTTTLSGAGGTAWDMTATPSTTSIAPNNTWFIFEGSTRPMLMMENTATITNTHQLQIMGAALGKDYSLVQNIDATAAMNSLSDVWHSNAVSEGGFVPIGNATTKYTATFNGNGFAINGLYMNYTNGSDIGLFGSTSSTALITNVGLTGGSITGASLIGGIVGNNQGQVTNSYNTSEIIAIPSYLSSLGGLVGYNDVTGVISNSYNAGRVGLNDDNDVFSGIGGVVGINAGSISTSYNTGYIHRNGIVGNVGGLVGANLGTGSITDSYNAGAVVTGSSINSTGFGGIAGVNDGTITRTISYGYVNKPSGINDTGGLVGINNGTITASFWDTDTTGQSAGVGSGSATGTTGGCFNGVCTNGGTANLSSNVSPNTYTAAGWDTSTIWNLVEDQSYPYLRAFYSTTPRIIMGSTSADALNTVNLAINGTDHDSTYLFANQSFYFLEGYNNISSIDKTIADSTTALVYINSGAILANNVVAIPTATGSLSGTTALTLTANTVTAGNAGTSGALSNDLLSAAKGALVNSNILYSVDGINNLTLNSGVSFLTTATTAFTLNANATATNANISFGGAVTLSTDSTVSTINSGNIAFNSAFSGSNDLVINAAGTASFNGANTSRSLTVTAPLGISTGYSTSFTTSGLNNAGDIIFNNPVTADFLTGSFSVITTNGGSIIMNGVTGQSGLIATAAGGANADVTLNGTYGGGIASATITASGNINLNGDVTSVGNQTYTGAVTLGTAGTGTFTSSTGDIFINNGLTGNGTNALVINNAGAGSYINGVVSNLNGLTKTGVGSLSLAGANTYAGKTTISNGLLSINSLGDVNGGASALGTPDSVANGTIDISPTGTLRYTGTGSTSDRVINILGSGATVDASGTGPLVLNGGFSGSGFNLNLTGTGTAIQNGQAILFGGAITKSGSGTWILGSGTSGFSGGATINAGTLQIGNGGSIGSAAGNFINNGSLVFNASNAINVTGAITGTGTVTQAGSGTTSLSSTSNTYSGGTIINAGTLSVAADSNLGAVPVAFTPSSINLNGGALNLSNTFTLNANRGITLLSASTISTTAGTPTINSAINNNGFALTVANTTDLTLAGIISGSGALIKNNIGTLTLGASNIYTGATNINNGVLNLTTINGLGSGATQSSTINIASGATLATTLAANSTIANTNTIFMNGTGYLNQGAIVSLSVNGTPTYDNAIVLMGNTSIGGTAELVFNGNISENTAGTSLTKIGSTSLTLGGSNTYTGATNINQGYLRLTNANALGSGATQSSAINITGNSGLNFGTAMTLANTNLMTLNATGVVGVLSMGITGAGDVVLNNNILLAANTTLGTSNGSAGNILTLNGQITGPFALTKSGITSLALTNANNTYSGGTIFNGDTFTSLYVDNAGALGTGAIALNGGYVRLNFAGTLANTALITVTGTNNILQNIAGTTTLNNAVTINGGASLGLNTVLSGSNLVLGGNITNNNTLNVNLDIIFGGPDGNVEIAGVLSGNGNLFKERAGTTLILSNNNTSTGGILVNGGTLQLGNGGTTGNVTSNITNNADVVFNHSGNITFANTISGTGNVTKTGTGTLSLTVANSYSGLTTINAGTLQIADTLGLGTSAVTINNAALSLNGNFNISNNLTMNSGTLLLSTIAATQNSLTGTINLNSGDNTVQATNFGEFTSTLSGSGNLIKTGAEQFNLNGNNVNYDGNIVINDGSIHTISSTGFGSAVGTTTINNGAQVALNTGASTLAINETFIINNGSIATFGANNAAINGGIAVNGPSQLQTEAGRTLTVNGNVSGNGALSTANGGSVILVADNTYTGTLTIGAGILQLGNGGATGSLGTGAVVNNAAFIIDRTGTLNLSNAISGSGTLTTNGSALINVGGNNSYAGITNINAGTVNVLNANGLGSVAAGTNVATGATLIINGVNVGAETLALNGGTFGGIGAAGFDGAITLNTAAANFSNNGGTFTLGGTINGGQGLTLSGGGTTILNGDVGNVTRLDSFLLDTGTALAVNGGGIATIGDQEYRNNINVGNNAVFSMNGAGTRSMTFAGDINAGANSVTLSGTQIAGTPTYLFTVNGITASSATITATSNSINNVLALNASGTQNFTITANNVGNVTGIATVAGAVDFANIQNLIGGSGADNFNFSSGSRLNGSLNGGAGVNSVTGSNAANNWVVNTNNGGTLATALDGTFANIQNLIGGSANDNFTFTTGSRLVGGNVNGGAGTNTLTAGNNANVWMITANNTGTLATAMDGSFFNIQNLNGGSGSDSFNFTANDLQVTGIINGGGDLNNTINFNLLSDALLLRLSNPVIPNVLDIGNVYSSTNVLLASFTGVQASTGNAIGTIELPSSKSLSDVTFYTPDKLNGEIGDPFYFTNWMIAGAPVPPTPPAPPNPPIPPIVFDPYIAPIVNQPITNSQNNNNPYNPSYNNYGDTIINQTYTDPLLNTTSVVETGDYCYAPSSITH